MDNDTIEPTTEAQKLAHKLAIAYRGFIRGVETKDDFDMWYYGMRLADAQDAIGFEMVKRSLIDSLSRHAGIALDEARAAKQPVGIDTGLV